MAIEQEDAFLETLLDDNSDILTIPEGAILLNQPNDTSARK